MRPARLLLAGLALLQTAALGPTTVPCSNKDVANGIRDGLQSALRSRKSRLAVELPPGAPLALRGGDDDAGFGWFKKKETETAKIVKGDRALADFLSLLFPDDFKIGAVYASEEAAVAAAAADKTKGARALISALNPDGAVSVGGGAKKVKKKSRRRPKTTASGFGASSAAAVAEAPKKLWCPALGLPEPCEVILIIGGLDAQCAETVDAAANELGDDVAIVLCNSRRDGLSARPGSIDGDAMWLPAFALSPPPPPASGDDASDLVAAFSHPGPWAIGKPKAIGGGADTLWTGDAPPSPEDVDAALAAVDDPLAGVKNMFSR
jgi:hypothetical protein